MSDARAWRTPTYQRHLRSLSDLERDAAEFLVAEVNRLCDYHLTVCGRPDKTRRSGPSADFVYADGDAGLRVAIEVKRPLLSQSGRRRNAWDEFAAEVRCHFCSPVVCFIRVDESWRPPRSTGKERQQRGDLCRLSIAI